MTNYDALNKSELWALIKTRQNTAGVHSSINDIVWQTSKRDMVYALIWDDNQHIHLPVPEVVSAEAVSDDFSLWDEIVSEALGEEIVDSTPPTLSGTVVHEPTNQIIPKADVITESHTSTEVSPPKLDVITSTTSTVDTTEVANVITSTKKSTTTKASVSSAKALTNTPDTVITRTTVYTWQYLDHEMSGRWKQITEQESIEQYIEFLEAVNAHLQANNAKTFLVRNCTLSVKMKPRIVKEQDVNGRTLNRIDRSAQKNNMYDNRNRTSMATTETAGRNIGEAAVKASVLFQASRYIPQAIRVNNAWNIDGIDTISVNGKQVYPVSLTAAIDESEPVNQDLPTKVLKRREISAEKKVEGRSFSHIRGKINNGLSPSFKDGDKFFCFQVDSNNRVSLWLLSNDVNHTVSASDLVKGRKLADIGYVEAQPYQETEFVNVTMDMIKGGQEARVERFDWIRKQLNKQWLDSDEAIYQFLSNLKKVNGEALVITNLQVIDGVVTGNLYGSKLIIRKRNVTKHRVVFHPVIRSSFGMGERNKKTGSKIIRDTAVSRSDAYDRIIAAANTWLFGIGGSVLSDLNVRTDGLTHRNQVIGLHNAQRNARTRERFDGTKKSLRNPKDRKYIAKLLTRFTTNGIFTRTDGDYIGKLTKTDGSQLTESEITRITEVVMNNYPVNKPLATLFTPSHFDSPEEWQSTFLNLLKAYGDIEVAILEDGKLLTYNTGNQVLEGYARELYSYLQSMGKEVDTLTMNGAIELLQMSPSSPYKEILLRVPNVAQLNGSQSLRLLAGHDRAEAIAQRRKESIYNLTVGLEVAKLDKVAADKAAKLAKLTQHLK
jgi:hypothetical protein